MGGKGRPPAGCDPVQLGQSTNPYPSGYLEARMAELDHPHVGARGQAAETSPTESAHQERPRVPTFDLLELRRDPRLIFRHTDGNAELAIRSQGAFELTVEPKIGNGNSHLFSLQSTVQSRGEVKCSLSVGSLRCEFYYIPTSDGLVLLNTGKYPVS